MFRSDVHGEYLYLNVDADHSDIDFNLIIEAELYYGLTQTGSEQIGRLRISSKTTGSG